MFSNRAPTKFSALYGGMRAKTFTVLTKNRGTACAFFNATGDPHDPWVNNRLYIVRSLIEDNEL